LDIDPCLQYSSYDINYLFINIYDLFVVSHGTGLFKFSTTSFNPDNKK